MSQIVPLTEQEARGAEALAGAPKELTSAKKLVDSVPVFSSLRKGNLLLEFTTRAGKLIFHVYHVERKRLVDEALVEAGQSTDNPRHIQILQERLTDQLEKHPWWNGVGERLHYVFQGFFRDDVRVVFDPEVDSWSVTVRAPMLPTAWVPDTQKLLFDRLYAYLSQG